MATQKGLVMNTYFCNGCQFNTQYKWTDFEIFAGLCQYRTSYNYFKKVANPGPRTSKLGGPGSSLVAKMYTFDEEIIQNLMVIPGHLLLKSGGPDTNLGGQWPPGHP